MTTAYERTKAVIETRKFLQMLSSADEVSDAIADMGVLVDNAGTPRLLQSASPVESRREYLPYMRSDPRNYAWQLWGSAP
jgi:hypothetical protein